MNNYGDTGDTGDTSDPCSPTDWVPEGSIIEEDKKAYRHFNQPIEQIQGFKPSTPQILIHTGVTETSSYDGLAWVDLDCQEIVTCISIGPISEGDPTKQGLIAERKQILVFKKGSEHFPCTIELVTCPSDCDSGGGY